MTTETDYHDDSTDHTTESTERATPSAEDSVGWAIINDIQTLTAANGQIPTTDDFRAYSNYTLPTVYKRWDSWADALRAAGVTETTTTHTTTSRTENGSDE